MTTRKELVAALKLRYGSAPSNKRTKILDEFVALTGITESTPSVC
jgi:hypothetical protein